MVNLFIKAFEKNELVKFAEGEGKYLIKIPECRAGRKNINNINFQYR